MSFKLPSPNDMGNVVRDSLHHYLEWHICEHYGVHRIDDLTVTEITASRWLRRHSGSRSETGRPVTERGSYENFNHTSIDAFANGG